MLCGQSVDATWAIHVHGSQHTGEGNQFMGVVELSEGEIVELKLRIDRKPTNMRSKVLLEAKLVQKIDKY